ncbi:hypothetical protein CVIRNUC_006133 [Coccomyxa viridis]|uniref:G-patch domain-containing protein n=1 Tax=Coccomyxa viridis TaxID=1274662 RepID=A0AAV1IAS8_9CHLO|nr:hypothetical protein CVIRNUC_006133 [Coccomyxa viridis]
MEAQATTVGSQHTEAPAAAAVGMPTSNGTGVTLKFDGPLKRKRPADLVSDRGKVVGFGDEDAAKKVTQGVRKIIPKIENTFNAEEWSRKKSTNRFIPMHEEQGSTAERFEAAAPDEVNKNTQYGLIQRSRDASEAASSAGAGAENGGTRDWELAKFKSDMERLPEEASLDAYDAMPVSAFGEAMMRGMGWKEGMSVGKNAPKEEVKAKEYVARPSMLGLGAKPSEILQRPPKQHIRQGETREPKKDMIYVDAEGNQRHVKDADAKLVEREKEGVHPGKVMAILAGTHAGLMCQVLALEPKVAERSQRATVRLEPSREAVSVRVKDIGERSEAQAPQEREAANGSSEPHKHSSKHKHHKERKQKHQSRAQELPEGRAPEQAEPQGTPWLAEHILVKIIDKRLQGGRLYLKRGEVVDVPQPTSCSIVVAETCEKLSGVLQSQLETVVPKEECRRVLVVLGGFRGQRAKLLRRDSQAGTAVVQLTADYSAQELSFDEVSEYVGPLGEEE